MIYIMLVPFVTGVFPIVSGLVYLLSLVFGFSFSWTLSLGVWVALVIALICLLIFRSKKGDADAP